MDATRTKGYLRTHHRMIPQREWDMVCMDIGIYPYPVAQKEADARSLTMDNGHQAFLLEEAGGSKGCRMQCFYTASLEYWFALALVTDNSGCRRFLLYNYNKYTTMLFEEDIDDAAALIRLIVRFAGSVKGAEDCPIEIHDTTDLITAENDGRYNFSVLSFMLTGYTWYGGILPGLVPARKSKPANDPTYFERDYKVQSISLDSDETLLATKRKTVLAMSNRLELCRQWNKGERSYFGSSSYWDNVRKNIGTGCQPLSEWWILPAKAVRAFCAVAAMTRRTRKKRGP